MPLYRHQTLTVSHEQSDKKKKRQRTKNNIVPKQQIAAGKHVIRDNETMIHDGNIIKNQIRAY